jgi:hypothetical protein
MLTVVWTTATLWWFLCGRTRPFTIAPQVSLSTGKAHAAIVTTRLITKLATLDSGWKAVLLSQTQASASLAQKAPMKL